MYHFPIDTSRFCGNSSSSTRIFQLRFEPRNSTNAAKFRQSRPDQIDPSTRLRLPSPSLPPHPRPPVKFSVARQFYRQTTESRYGLSWFTFVEMPRVYLDVRSSIFRLEEQRFHRNRDDRVAEEKVTWNSEQVTTDRETRQKKGKARTRSVAEIRKVNRKG